MNKARCTKRLCRLPKPAGATLEIGDDEREKNICNPPHAKMLPDNQKQLHVVATMHQQLVYMANANLTETTSIGGAIPTAELATGLLQITLFSADWKPLAERICFCK